MLVRVFKTMVDYCTYCSPPAHFSTQVMLKILSSPLPRSSPCKSLPFHHSILSTRLPFDENPFVTVSTSFSVLKGTKEEVLGNIR